MNRQPPSPLLILSACGSFAASIGFVQGCGLRHGCERDSDCDPGMCEAARCLLGICLFTDRNGATCDDGDPCTTDDVCAARSSCVGVPIVCDEGLFCAEGACVECTAPEHCPDDGVFCNGQEFCEGGVCAHSGNPCGDSGACGDMCFEFGDLCVEPCFGDGECSDEVFCNGVEWCDGCLCHSGEPACPGACNEQLRECE